MEFVFTIDQEGWLNDLEKTRAKQGTGALHNTSGWCCLGRACKVAGITPQIVGINNRISVYTRIGCGDEVALLFDGHRTDLPSSVFRKLHLRSNMGLIKDAENYPELKGNTTLTDLNDMLGWTFKQIARWIRKNPAVVFTRGLEEDQ